MLQEPKGETPPPTVENQPPRAFQASAAGLEA